MELSEELYNLVSRYVEGDMTDEEKKSFEALLVQNKELQDEVTSYKEIQSISESLAQKISDTNLLKGEEDANQENSISSTIRRARENLENIQAESSKKKVQMPGATFTGSGVNTNTNEGKSKLIKKRFIKYPRLVAAAVIILFGSLVVWWYRSQQENAKMVIERTGGAKKNLTLNDSNNAMDDSPAIGNQDTVENFVEIPRNQETIGKQNNSVNRNSNENLSVTERKAIFEHYYLQDTIPEDVAGPLRKALQFYDNGKYDQAIIALEENQNLVRRGVDETEDLTSFYVSYYQAQSYLALNKIDQAVTKLKTAISQNPEPILKTKAQWYLALAYLKSGDMNNASVLLKRIAAAEYASDYRDKARKIMSELNNTP